MLLKERFESKFIVDENECWIWIEHKDRDGYGKVRVGKDKLRAHRVSYELYVDKIPAGMLIDHLCKVKSCVNPKHLEIVDIKESNRRRPVVRFCDHGEPITTCDDGCFRLVQRLYIKKYYAKNSEALRKKARIKYRSITQEQRERRNFLARERYRKMKEESNGNN